MPRQLIRVNVDLFKARILQSLPHKSDFDRIVKGLGKATLDYWTTLAKSQLRSTSRDYVNALQLYERGGSAFVELGDGPKGSPIPNMVEQGWSGGDMRDWMLSSPKAKNGRLVIPFRHGTPGTGGRNVGRVMPKAIHSEAKKLVGSLSRPGKPIRQKGGQTTIHGKRLHPHKGMRDQARDILNSKEKDWHATSIYMGMIKKEQKTSSGKVQTSGFTTFRTISRHTRDKENHWIHHGIKARNIAQQVSAHVEKIADNFVQMAMR